MAREGPGSERATADTKEDALILRLQVYFPITAL